MEKWKEKVRVRGGRRKCAYVQGSAESARTCKEERREGEKCPRGTRQDRIPAFSVFAGDFSSPPGPDLHNYGLRE